MEHFTDETANPNANAAMTVFVVKKKKRLAQ
jgi:hypothetical protein